MATATTPTTEVKCFTKPGFTLGGYGSSEKQVHTLYAESGVEIQALLKVLEQGKNRDPQLEIMSVQLCDPRSGFSGHYDVYFTASANMLFGLGYDWRAEVDLQIKLAKKRKY